MISDTKYTYVLVYITLWRCTSIQYMYIRVRVVVHYINLIRFTLCPYGPARKTKTTCTIIDRPVTVNGFYQLWVKSRAFQKLSAFQRAAVSNKLSGLLYFLHVSCNVSCQASCHSLTLEHIKPATTGVDIYLLLGTRTRSHGFQAHPINRKMQNIASGNFESFVFSNTNPNSNPSLSWILPNTNRPCKVHSV